LGRHFFGGGSRRALLLIATCSTAVLSAAGIATAGGGSASGPAPTEATIVTKLQGDHFVFRPTATRIASGGTIEIQNRNPGVPHTITLVRPALLPDTRRERRQCFSPGRICFKGAQWHRAVDRNPNNDLNLVEVSRPGFNQMGGLNRKGDSIFFTRNPRSVTVSAVSGRTLSFMCIIHPNMQGEFEVE
jgi:plastocyanin